MSMDQPPSSFLDLNEEKPQHDDHLFNPNPQISYPPKDQEGLFCTQPQRFQLQAPLEANHKVVSSGTGSWDRHHPRAEESESGDKNDDIQDTNHGTTFHDSVKWTSSKMRMMKKMIGTNPNHHHHHHHQTTTVDHHHDHHRRHAPLNFTLKLDRQKRAWKSPSGADHSSSSSSNIANNGTIRVCADCNTTTTPLWRSGPRGPKSLCNACGIRQRKARRAMAAAVEAANMSTIVAADASSVKSSATKIQHKEKKSKAFEFKKRSQPRGRKTKLACFEDLRMSMSKNSAFQRVFPQDERDAAILLMALSYGLVHG